LNYPPIFTTYIGNFGTTQDSKAFMSTP